MKFKIGDEVKLKKDILIGHKYEKIILLPQMFFKDNRVIHKVQEFINCDSENIFVYLIVPNINSESYLYSSEMLEWKEKKI